METNGGNTDLPEGWIRCHSKSMKGKIYYFNTLTGESLWEHPEAVLLNNQETEKHLPVENRQGSQVEFHGKYAGCDNVVIGSSVESYSEIKLTNGRKLVSETKFTREKKFRSDSSSANDSTSSLGKQSVVDLKLKPIVKSLKKLKTPKTRKDSNGAKVEKNISTKNITKLKSALDYLAEEAYPVNNKKLFSQESKKLSHGNVGISYRTDEVEQNKHDRYVPSGKIQSKNYGSHRPAKTLNSDGLGSKEDEIGNSSEKSQGVHENHKLKSRTLTPLKPLKQHRPDQVKSRITGAVWNYKIPKNVKNLNETLIQGQSSYTNKSSTGKLSPSEQSSYEKTHRKVLQTVRSADSLSDRSSSSWSTSDVVMTSAMDTERVNDTLQESWPTSDEIVVEEMDIDDAEFISKRILREIENIRVERIEIPEMDFMNTVSSEAEFKDTSLFIVIDTNILLSHLKFVRELMDSPIPGAGRPVLVIPWMVTQELDRLKSAPSSRVHEFDNDCGKPGTSVNILARRTIAFLNECFSESHPRLRGQTAYEAKQPMEGLIQETNDDSILHCCLLFKAKAPQTMTVLLSNDRNLCNKAIVNGVKAFDNKKLINGLRDLFQTGNIIVDKDHFKEYFKVAENQEFLAERKKKADDLICELQCILREAFAAIVEKEMKEAYDELWSTIVKIKPPWTLSDTLDLFDKHWIAVFGHIVHRSLKASILDMKRKFSSGDVMLRDLDIAGQMIDLGYQICTAFANHSDYDGVLPKCIAGLIILQRTFKQYSTSLTLLRHSNEVKPALSLPAPHQDNSGDKIVSDCVKRVLHDSSPEVESNDAHANAYFTVMMSFDAIWKTVRVLSASIFHSLEYPNPYQDEGDITLQRSTKEETFQFLNQFIPCLERLVQAIQKVVACPVESSMANTEVFVELGESIAQFMKTMMSQDCNITFDELYGFCIDNQCRTALIQGLSQLDRALAMLQHCASYAANRSSNT